MIAKSTTAALRRLANDHLLPAFRRSGFQNVKPDHSGYALVCRRRTKDATQVVDLQRDKYWNREEGKLAVNIGVHVPEVAVFRGQPSETRVACAPDCSFAQRLNVVAVGHDEWWSIAPESDLERLSGEILGRFEKFGLPWLEQCSTVRGAHDWVLHLRGRSTLELHVLLGDIEGARELLTTCLLESSNDPSELLRFALKHGLIAHSWIPDLELAVIQHVATKKRLIPEIMSRPLA